MKTDYAKQTKIRKPGAVKWVDFYEKKVNNNQKSIKFFDTALVICAILLIAIGFGAEFWSL